MSRSDKMPDEAPSRAADQDRADAPRRQQLRRRREIGRRFDADDVAAQVAFLAAKMLLTFMAASLRPAADNPRLRVYVNDPAAIPVPSSAIIARLLRARPHCLMPRCTNIVILRFLRLRRRRIEPGKQQSGRRESRRYALARPPPGSLPCRSIGNDPSPNRRLIPNQTARNASTRGSRSTPISGIAGTR